MAENEDTLEIKGLENILKALKGKIPQFRIGILGGAPRQPKKGETKTVTNALVGAVHEFGSPARNIPQRSFLRIPLIENLQKELESSGLLNQKSSDEVIKQGSLKPWLDQVAICAEAVVMDAFETSGDGKWPAWRDPNYTNEGGMLLVDSQQLRNSITSEVK